MCRFLILVIVLPSGLTGCAWRQDRLGEARHLFYSGQLERAGALLDEIAGEDQQLADVARLDRAIVSLASGDSAQAERELRGERDRLDYLEQASAKDETLAMLSDDLRRAYAGEPYERVLVRSLLAVANLMHDGGDALAYTLQAQAKQAQLAESPAAAELPPVAWSTYLYGVLREEMLHHDDDALRSYHQVAAWQPDFSAAGRDIRRLSQGRHVGPGNGVAYVFVFAGRGPHKVEAVEVPSTAALLIAEQLVRVSGRQDVPMTAVPVKVPRLLRSPPRVAAVRLIRDGQPAGATEVVTRIGQLGEQTFLRERDQVVARAVARRVVKKGIAVAGKHVLGSDSLGPGAGAAASVAVALGSLAWDAAERADLRNWGLLPDNIQVARLEMPAGEHQLQLQAVDAPGHPLGKPRRQTVRIREGRNTYVLAQVPDTEFIGAILVR